MSSSPALDLGTPETAPPAELLSRYFPSKVGGKPAWLALRGIPSPTCTRCSGALTFLLQLYAPLDENSRTFHRTLFVFFCWNTTCHQNGDSTPFTVYRSQLKKENTFYPSTPAAPPTGEDDWRLELSAAAHGTALCVVCGCPGEKKCAGCQKASYCGKEHQTWHWKKGGHKVQCTAEEEVVYDGPTAFNLPEFEVVIDEAEEEDFPEEEENDDDSGDDDKAELEKYKTMAKKVQTDVAAAVTEEDTTELDPETVYLARFFKPVVKHTPDQVVRHSRRGAPLWIALANRTADDDVPACQCCGAKRVFEFQIMPQLLNKLKLDVGGFGDTTVDWGVLAVYTCEKSCDWKEPDYYKKEFIHRQNIPSAPKQ